MAEIIQLDQLASRLDLGTQELVSLVGGGGKTTTLFALGQQLMGTTILTTTTKMGRDRDGGFPVLVGPSDGELADALVQHRSVLVWRSTDERKALGVAPEVCDAWMDIADNVVVEADGSRRKPFKAPREFEPVIASRTTTVIACVGADALGRVISDQCQRPLRVAAIAGCSPYERLTPERAASVLLSDRGSKKGVPAAARFVVLVCRVDGQAAEEFERLAEVIGDRARVLGVGAFDDDRAAIRTR